MFLASVLLCTILAVSLPEEMLLTHVFKEVQKADPVKLLQGKWVLREKLYKEEQELKSKEPQQEVTIIFYSDQAYKLIRENPHSNNIHGAKTIERGEWEYIADRGLIGVNVTNVDGLSIKTTKAYRWEVAKISRDKLILSVFYPGTEFLVFEKQEE